MFYLMSNQLNKISKSGWKQRYPVLCEEFEKEKKRGQKFLTFRIRDRNPRLSVIFLPMIWSFMESEGDEIKPR